MSKKDEGQGGNESGAGSGSGQGSGAQGGSAFSQEDVNKLVGNARQEASTRAAKDLLKQLGVEDLDAAKALVERQRQADEAAKTEAERLAAERDAAKAEAQAAIAKANEALASAALQGALRDAGIKPERIAAAVKLVDRSGLSVADGEVKGVAEAIEALKGESPEWFGSNKAAAPDASGGGGSAPIDFSKADPETLQRHMRDKYGLSLR